MNKMHAARIVLVAVILLSSAFVLGAAGTGEITVEMVKGTGNPKTESYDLTGFRRVKLIRVADFEISQADSFSVSLTADSNIIEQVTVSKDGSWLTVGVPATHDHKSVKAMIALPDVYAVSLSGGSKGRLRQIEAREVRVTASGGSSLQGQIEADAVWLTLSSGSQAEISGWTDHLVLEASDNSSAFLNDFTASAATVSLGATTDVDDRDFSTAYAEIFVNGNVDVVLCDESELQYSGNVTLSSIATGDDTTLERAEN